MATRFGEVRDTFYGDVWDVKTMDESRNIAYTNLFLPLHMGLQCVRQFSILIVIFKNDTPSHLQVLRVPATLPDPTLPV